MSKRPIGSSIDDFLKDEGVFEETQAQAIKEELVAWQLTARGIWKIHFTKVAFTRLEEKKYAIQITVSMRPRISHPQFTVPPIIRAAPMEMKALQNMPKI